MPSPAIESQPDLLHMLVQDHLLSRSVLDAMEQRCVQERAGRPLQVAFWLQVLDSFDGYFDRVHHCVEDELLLPRLALEGFAANGSDVRQMMQEHERMTSFRQHLRHALGQRARGGLHAIVQAFVALHRQHLAHEEQHVFALVRTMLSKAVQYELAQDLELRAAANASERAAAELLVASLRQQVDRAPPTQPRS